MNPGIGGMTFRRIVRRFADALSEMSYAQRRAYVLRASLDSYSPNRDEPPQSYEEFLARTSGPLLREPNARVRLEGRRVG